MNKVLKAVMTIVDVVMMGTVLLVMLYQVMF